MSKQLGFQNLKSTKAFKDHEGRSEHGGSIRKGKRKLYRPFDSRRPLHLILRSSQARGAWSFLRPRNQKEVDRHVYGVASQFGIKIYKFANSGNHLHMMVQATHKDDFKNFLRTLSALLARSITNARKGHPLKKRFWDQLAYTRLVTWGREFKLVKRYVVLNTLEAFGLAPKREKGERTTKKVLDIDLEEYLNEAFVGVQGFG